MSELGNWARKRHLDYNIMKVWEDTRKADEGQEAAVRWTETRRSGTYDESPEQQSRGEAASSPLNHWARSPEPCRVSRPAGGGRYWHILSFAWKHFRKMTWGSLLSLLRTADLAMGQGLCLIDLCVSRELWTWPDMPAQAGGQRPLQNSAHTLPSVLTVVFLSSVGLEWWVCMSQKLETEGKFF